LKIYYWKSATGSSRLLRDHSGTITRILSGDYNHCDLEKLHTSQSYPVYSFRLNKCDRLLFTTYKNCLYVLEFIPNHRYSKSRVLRLGLSETDFTCLSENETLPTFERDEGATESIPLEYYSQLFIALSDEQNAATSTPLPAVVLGGAGTGKTLIALSLLSHRMQAGQKLLYICPFSLLVNKIQRQWQNSFAVADGCTVAFSNYNTFFSFGDTIVGKSEFSVWFGNQKANSSFDLDDASSYAECFTCSGFGLADYVALGARQSRILGEEARIAFYTKVFSAYCTHLDGLKQFDPAFSCVPAPEESVYDFIVVDEAQNFSLHQLRQLERRARHHAIVYCMDSQQNLSSGCPVRDLLTQSFFKNGITLHLAQLNTTHRYTHNVARALNHIKSMARIIQGGSLDKQEAVLISLAPNDEGTFRCMGDSGPLPAFVIERANSTEFAVITLPEFQGEAIEKFNTSLVLTPEQSIGQEFHTVVVYKLWSDEQSAHIIRQILPLFNSKKSVPVHLPKDKNTPQDTVIQTWINRFYVACSRAKNSLVILQSLTNKQRCILSGFFDTGTIQSVSLQTAWAAAQEEQLSRGNHEVAERIAAKIAACQAPQRTAQEKIANDVSLVKKNPSPRKSAPKKSRPIVQTPQYDPELGRKAFKIFTRSGKINTKFTLLLKNPKLDVNQTDEYGETLLMLACGCGHDSLLQTLLTYCKPRLEINLTSEDDFTPLMVACQAGHHTILKMLLAHFRSSLNVNYHSRHGFTALMMACKWGQDTIVNMLLECYGSDLNVNLASKTGYTPLMMACEDGHHDVVKALLKHSGPRLEINLQTTENKTAIMLACQAGRDAIVKTLIEYCKDKSFLTPMKSHQTALMCAYDSRPVSSLCLAELLNDKQFLTEATEYVFYNADGDYAKTLMVKMLNKKYDIFDILTDEESLRFRSEKATIHFQEKIYNNQNHPINKILSFKSAQFSLLSSKRNLVDEFVGFMARLAPDSGYIKTATDR